VEPEKKTEKNAARSWLALAGFMSVYVMLAVIVFDASRSLTFTFSFFRVSSLADAYSKALYYLPVFAFYALSLSWPVMAGVSLQGLFAWKKPGAHFYAALALCLGYVVISLALTNHGLRGPAFWPPLLVLSLLNAVGEEIFYRGALYGLLEKTVRTLPAVIGVQAVLYGLVHIPLGSPLVALYAFFFGLLAGWIRFREGGLSACIALHLVVDVSALGQGFLRMY
jgi:membrane protease YdiL (CAAX protease family)